MGMRRVAGLSLLAGLIAMLTACSVPAAHGVRLNADGTIDFVDCWGPEKVVAVNYLTNGLEEDVTEWEASGEPEEREAVVVRYGEAPDGYFTTVLLDPPAEWVAVDFGFRTYDRIEMVEGEWLWEGGVSYPWMPPHPCDGVDLDDLEL